MSRIKFTADSTCDLPAEILKELDVSTMPLTISLGDNHFHDGVDVTPDDIYKYVTETKVLPKTAARSPEEYRAFFEGFLASGYDEIVHLDISSEISASYQNAALAAKELKGVHVIDSRQLSTGTSVLLYKGIKMMNSGADGAKIAERLNEIKNNVQTSFVVETLDYLYKGGRCSSLQRFGANLLSLRPYIKMRGGQLGVGGKYRGKMAKVFLNYIDDLAEEFTDYDADVAFVTHSGCAPEVVQSVKEQVAKKFEFTQVIETVAGSTITSHCGKGTLGLLFLSNKPLV